MLETYKQFVDKDAQCRLVSALIVDYYDSCLFCATRGAVTDEKPHQDAKTLLLITSPPSQQTRATVNAEHVR